MARKPWDLVAQVAHPCCRFATPLAVAWAAPARGLAAGSAATVEAVVVAAVAAPAVEVAVVAPVAVRIRRGILGKLCRKDYYVVVADCRDTSLVMFLLLVTYILAYPPDMAEDIHPANLHILPTPACF